MKTWAVVLTVGLGAGVLRAGEYQDKGAWEKKQWEQKQAGQQGQWAKPQFKAPVVVNEIGFQAAKSGGKIAMSWKKYKRPDFKYYKVVRSNTNNNPVYPEDPAIKFFDDASQTSFEDWAQPGTWHYRLCVITQTGDRWVSPVVTIDNDAPPPPSAPPSAADFE